jgi:hypothetical protein
VLESASDTEVGRMLDLANRGVIPDGPTPKVVATMLKVELYARDILNDPPIPVKDVSHADIVERVLPALHMLFRMARSEKTGRAA